MSNPNIGNAGVKFKKNDQRTKQIGKENGERNKMRACIRANERRLAAFEPAVDADGNPIVTMKAMKQAFGADKKGKRLNMAEIWAVIHAKQASQDHRAMKDLIDNVSGKLLEKSLNATVSYAELIAAVDKAEQDEG